MECVLLPMVYTQCFVNNKEPLQSFHKYVGHCADRAERDVKQYSVTPSFPICPC